MKKTMFILLFLVALVTIIGARSLTIRAYDSVTNAEINAHIYINNVDTGQLTPHTFIGAAFVTGHYSCQLVGYSSWQPVNVFFGGVNADFTFPFFGTPDDEPPVPVELSSFSALITADFFVVLAWTTESETDHAGYNLLRGESADLESAIQINNGYIVDENQVGSQRNYTFTDEEVYPGTTYYYWLESVSLSGGTDYFGPLSVLISDTDDQEIPPIPKATELLNAYPNPFNPNATLQYTVKDAAQVSIQVYNTRGQLIRQFENSHSLPGCYNFIWDGKDSQGNNVCSGVYLYRMTSGTYSATKRMLLSK